MSNYTRAKYVLDYLRENPEGEFTAAEIADALAIPEGTAGGALSTAHAKGKIARRRVGRAFRYTYTHPAEEIVITEYEPKSRRERIADAWSVAFGQRWTPELVAVALRIAEGEK